MERQTLVITLLDEQAATWQGVIQWLEGQKTTHFRSTMELLHLIDEIQKTANGIL